MPSTLTTRGFMSCNQIRPDSSPAAAPGLIGSMTDMAAVATASVQAMSSSHKIEHLASKSARSEQEMMALMRGIWVWGLNCGSAW
jgi:hypothetical protein